MMIINIESKFVVFKFDEFGLTEFDTSIILNLYFEKNKGEPADEWTDLSGMAHGGKLHADDGRRDRLDSG